jgi:hypothetical protein
LISVISGLKRNEIIGGWRKLHTEELHNLYSSPNIIRMIESRSMRWAGYVARMGRRRRRRRIYKILMRNQKERDHKEDLDVGGRIKLKWILEI